MQIQGSTGLANLSRHPLLSSREPIAHGPRPTLASIYILLIHLRDRDLWLSCCDCAVALRTLIGYQVLRALHHQLLASLRTLSPSYSCNVGNLTSHPLRAASKLGVHHVIATPFLLMEEEGFELILPTRSATVTGRRCPQSTIQSPAGQQLFPAAVLVLSRTNALLHPRLHARSLRYILQPAPRSGTCSIDTPTAPIDSAQNARSVREDTAELASYLLSEGKSQRSPLFLRSKSSTQELLWSEPGEDGSMENNACNSETIVEVSEPPSPSEQGEASGEAIGPSVLANLLKRSPPQSLAPDQARSLHDGEQRHEGDEEDGVITSTERGIVERNSATENTPLLGRIVSSGRRSSASDLEGQKTHIKKPWFSGLADVTNRIEEHMTHGVSVAINPRRWDHKAVWQNAVIAPVSCLPAVCVGLLLNILDALSYG